MENLFFEKVQLRQSIKEKLAILSFCRRKEAMDLVYELVLPAGNVLSFASFRDEIDMTSVNGRLLREGRLFLPTMDFNLVEIDLVLVPGRAFDSQNRRLGRGGGYYDRLLAKSGVKRWGIGFKEQRVEEVPVDVHDVLMDEIFLF